MNSDYDVIIIGSGIGGLTCGNLLAKNGLKTLILEQHFQPGGYCTSYKREKFVFNVPAIISSMRKGGLVENMFSYIGVNNHIDFIEIDKLAKLIGPDMEIDWYADIYKLEHEFMAKFPHEKKAINRYFKIIREILYEVIKLRSFDKSNLINKLIFPIKFPKFVKYCNYTLKQFLDKFFKDERLKEFLGKESATLNLSSNRVSALYYIIMVIAYANAGIWYPKGGFQKMSDGFVRCFKEYNGTLRLETEAKRIIVENKKAIGVELENGEKIYGKYIISNADTKKTFLELIDEKHLKKRFLSKIKRLKQSYPGFVVKLIVKMDVPELQNTAWAYIFPEYGNQEKMLDMTLKDEIDFENCSFGIETSSFADPEEQPEGFNIITLRVNPVPYNYKEKWDSHDKTKKEKLKEYLSDILIKRAEKIIPGLSKNIVYKDISTPLTYERYTAATNGAWYDIAVTPKQAIKKKMSSITQIKGLYLTGAKSIIGPGLSAAALSGLGTADLILDENLSELMSEFQKKGTFDI